jgi:flagellin
MKWVDAEMPTKMWAPWRGASEIQSAGRGEQHRIQEGATTMALGVLNNLSAMYAENSLNNTNASLQTVLQQLSSGSRINSGADDAAGLSLVNGLQANSSALLQSETNATEGVGFLDVADGALSQVTNLLNRAITLATEASNGTLNSTQESAANQEYQSIMAEVNNIGSTTTYNQQQVFSGSEVAIYTGDSSTAGSSIDDLNIRGLSSASIGDSNGAMQYGNGNGQAGTNVFVDLSNDGKLATVNDSLAVGGSSSTSIQVSYLQTGAQGAVTPATATVTVGTGTTYADTAQGMIDAINNAGLGLTASFGTAASGGVGAVAAAEAALYGGGSGTDTGIIISGTGLGLGASVGVVGTLTVGGTALDPLAGTLNVTGTDGVNHTITLGQADETDNINNLASTINAAGYGITATVAGTTLTFTSASSAASVSGTNLTDTVTTVEGGANLPVVVTAGAPKGNAAGTVGTFTLKNATDILTGGTLNITGQAGTLTGFVLGAPGTTDNLTNLAKTINNWAATTAAGAGVTATVVGVGLASDSVAASSTAVNIAGTPLTNAPSASTIGTLTLGGVGESVSDVLNGTLNIGTNSITLGGTGTTDTLQDLAKTVNAGDYGVTAVYNQANKTIVFNSPNSALGAVGGVTYVLAAGHGDQTTANGTLTYAIASPVTTAQDFYTIGIASAGGIQDAATNIPGAPITYGGTLNTGLAVDSSSTGGIATISYTDSNGESLKGSDLLTQSDAVTALNEINLAISDVAAQDGYIGAQINTLDSISHVVSTQQDNVVSAQNAIQATDYASATSNLSKYEVLSQTGISALAQANSVQQEVTKLLQ